MLGILIENCIDDSQAFRVIRRTCCSELFYIYNEFHSFRTPNNFSMHERP